jgi:hypothetical protein
MRIYSGVSSYTFKYLRSVATEATVETKSPVIKRIPEATQTSDQVKNLVKLSRGAILESTSNLNAESRPVENTQPTIAEIIPSSKNGNWIENDEAPTNFMTPVSRRRLKAAIRSVLLINSAAVRTLAKPIAKAPSRSTDNNLKNFSRMLR